MDKLIVEELKRFDKEKLPFYKIIYSKFKLSWILISLVLLITGFSFMGIFLLPVNIHHWWAVLISILFLFLSIIYLSNRTLIVLKEKYNKKYSLNIKDKWIYDCIQIIRVRKLRIQIKRIGITSTEQLRLIIEYLEYDTNSRKYNYTFSITLIVLILGALLSGFVAGLLDKTKSLNEFYQINRILLGIAIMIIFVVFYFERYVLKEFILWYRNRNKRLVQTIYNYMIEELKDK